ncbi:MAG TPA: GNAT family N-acetyltransferase [Polyangiaceae bacterium]|jgi:hypothetical protein
MASSSETNNGGPSAKPAGASERPPKKETRPPAAKAAPSEHPGAAKPKVSVVSLHTAAELQPYVARWEQLAKNATDPNPFLEPWLFIPGLQFVAGEELELVFVERRDGSLMGFFPFLRRKKYHGLPVPTLVSYTHDFHFVQTPLVHSSYARECLDALFDWLAKESKATLVELTEYAGDGAFQHAMIHVLGERDEPYTPVFRRTRGLYVRQKDADIYLASIADSEGRRKLRAKERNLGEQAGKVTYEELTSEADLPRWASEFLALEASGWKGDRGTAMAADPARKKFFEEAIGEAYRRKQLELTALRVGDRAVAMKCNFLSGGGGFVFKIGYDESLGKFSPGMLLEVDNIRRMHARTDLQWMDSCAHHKSRLFGDSCNQRKTFETLLVAPAGEGGKFLLSVYPLAQWVSRQVRVLKKRRAKTSSPS